MRTAGGALTRVEGPLEGNGSANAARYRERERESRADIRGKLSEIGRYLVAGVSAARRPRGAQPLLEAVAEADNGQRYTWWRAAVLSEYDDDVYFVRLSSSTE